MSPRAACRLEALGFDQVYDYTAGIADWKAAGLPTEGTATATQRVVDAVRSDIPTCRLEDTIGDVRSRTFAAGWDECVVIDCNRIVVGRIRNQAWNADDGGAAEEVMESGPTTVRPDGLLQPLYDRMATRGTKLVLVTTPQGALIGGVLQGEAGRFLGGVPPERIWRDCDGCPGRWSSPV